MSAFLDTIVMVTQHVIIPKARTIVPAIAVTMALVLTAWVGAFRY